MKQQTIAALALILLTIGFAPSITKAYFKTIPNLSEITAPNVVPSRYYDRNKPRFRTQRGRSEPSSPTTGNNRSTTRSKVSATISQEHAANRIRLLFGHANLSQNNKNPGYDNDQYSDSKIKFRTLVSHVCFEPAGSEIERCKKRFGSYFHLKESILDGSIYTILVTDNPDISQNITELYQTLVSQIKEKDAPPAKTKLEVTKGLRRVRMQDVWDVCKSQTADHRTAAVCYIRHSRLYLDQSLLNENVRFLE